MKKLVLLALLFGSLNTYAQINVSEVQNAIEGCHITLEFYIYGSNDCRTTQLVASYSLSDGQHDLYINTGNYDSHYAYVEAYDRTGNCLIGTTMLENACNPCTFGYPVNSVINPSGNCANCGPIFVQWDDCNALWAHL